MQKLDPKKFQDGAKELERQAKVVREAVAIIERMPGRRIKRRKKRAKTDKGK